jgi:hypothetical protein
MLGDAESLLLCVKVTHMCSGRCRCILCQLFWQYSDQLLWHSHDRLDTCKAYSSACSEDRELTIGDTHRSMSG